MPPVIAIAAHMARNIWAAMRMHLSRKPMGKPTRGRILKKLLHNLLPPCRNKRQNKYAYTAGIQLVSP